jgi:muramoyltetrapeptide carboxypeptidase
MSLLFHKKNGDYLTKQVYSKKIVSLYMTNRRTFISASLASLLTHQVLGASFSSDDVLKPKALKKGNTLGLVCPAYMASSHQDVEIAIETFDKMGFNVVLGQHFYDKYGYLAGKDADRAADINSFFADKNIHGIVAMNGGWGSARLLHLLDYELIKKNPKIFMGYSDITAILMALYCKTGLVTFHGPVGSSTFNAFSVDYLQRTLIGGEKVKMQNPKNEEDSVVQTKDRHWVIQSGIAKGRLIGGNLTVLTALLGSEYVPDFKGALLFLEDIGENIYRIDRMLTQLALNGVLKQIAGFVFGKCTDCQPSSGVYGSLTLEEVFLDHIKPLGIPAFTGAMIGHIENKFTVPIGTLATIDATLGTITLEESAVN